MDGRIRRYIWQCQVCKETFTRGMDVSAHRVKTGHYPITGEKHG